MSPGRRFRPDDVLGRVRRYLAVRLGTALALWAGTGVALLLAAAWLLVGEDGWRQGTPVPLLLDILAGLGGVVATTVLVRRWTRRLGERRVAAAVERSARLAEGEFLGAVELGRAVPRGTSPGLARLAEAGVVARVGGAPAVALAGALGGAVRRWEYVGAAAFAVCAAVVVVVTAASPERARAAWAGLLVPLRALAAPLYAPIEVAPGDAEVPRGAGLDVTVRAPGRERVMVRWQAAGDVARVRTVRLTDGRGGFRFDSITAVLTYRLSAPDGAQTPIYRIRPVDPLFLAELTVEVLYPPYSRRPSEQFAGEVPPLEIPAGTRLRITGRASRALSAASLAGPGGGVVAAFRVDGPRFRGEWVPRASGRYEWRLADASGTAPASALAPVEIRVAEDATPTIAVVFPGRDTVMPLTLRQPLVIEARDDFGVERMELVSYRVSSFGERGEPVADTFSMEGAEALVLRPVLDVSARRFLPGDTVRYFARVTESGPEAKSARTVEFALRLPGLAELRWEAQRSVEELAAGVEELAARAEAAQRETSELARRAATTANAARRSGARPTDMTELPEQARAGLDFHQSEDVRRAVETQERLLQQLDSLRAEAVELARALEEAGLADPELQHRLSELRELMEEVVSPELRRKLQEVAAALEALDPERVRAALEALAREQESLRAGVEEALELFRRAALEQQLKAVAQEAAELGRQEQALAEEMAQGRDLERRAEQQRALEERAKALQEELDRLDERLAQAGEEAVRPAAEQAGGLTERAEAAMRSAAQAAATGDARRAERGARNAASLMEQVARTIDQAREEMAGEWREAVQAALDRAAGDALALARMQASVMEAMGASARERMDEVRGTEAAVLQGVRQMAENLAQAARKSAMVDRALGAAVGRAMEALEQALQAMAGDAGPVHVPRPEAEAALMALNEVALRAMANGAQVAGSQSGTGVEQALEQLAELAGQQGALYREAGALAPLELGAGALARQLQQIGALQREIGQGLADLAGRPEAQDQLLGDLGAMAREAEELAGRLQRGELDRETVERQGRLFHRLLDAGRTLERDEWSEEREARQPGRYDPRRPPPLERGALGALRYAVPDAVELMRLSPGHRQMVLDYFERLNRMPREP